MLFADSGHLTIFFVNLWVPVDLFGNPSFTFIFFRRKLTSKCFNFFHILYYINHFLNKNFNVKQKILTQSKLYIYMKSLL
jgi:hypothetical protein